MGEFYDCYKKHKIWVKNRQGHGYTNNNYLRYWEEKQVSVANECARIGCDKTAQRGGHVYRPGTGPHPHYYIVPLCNSCNQTNYPDVFEVYEGDLVDAPTQN